MNKNEPTFIRAVPLALPRDAILRRLGRNRHHAEISPAQQHKLDQTLPAGFALCRPRAAWLRIEVARRTETELFLATGQVLTSAALVRLLAGCPQALLLAATVGEELESAISQCFAAGDAATAAIYDAVGSEVADSVLDWLVEHLRHRLAREGRKITAQRFSPGYGDLGLEAQQTAHELLQLSNLGIGLTPSLILCPEKSVIAIAGIWVNE